MENLLLQRVYEPKGVNESLGYLFTSLAHTILVLLLNFKPHSQVNLARLDCNITIASSSHATLMKQDCKVNKHWKKQTKSVDEFQIGCVSWILAGALMTWTLWTHPPPLVYKPSPCNSNWKTRSVNLSSNILHIIPPCYTGILWCSPRTAIYDLPKGAIQTTQPVYTSNTFVQKTRLAESPLHKVSWSKPQKMQSRMSIPAH